MEETKNKGKSEYKGDLWEAIKINIACCLIFIFTLGLGYPWAFCLKENYYISHTTIDGRKLYFDGHAYQLIGNYLIWFVLIIITFGIYSFYTATKLRQWKASHTHFL